MTLVKAGSLPRVATYMLSREPNFAGRSLPVLTRAEVRVVAMEHARPETVDDARRGPVRPLLFHLEEAAGRAILGLDLHADDCARAADNEVAIFHRDTDGA